MIIIMRVALIIMIMRVALIIMTMRVAWSPGACVSTLYLCIEAFCYGPMACNRAAF